MKKQIAPSIKAHLIRATFCLLLLAAICVIPFALGQWQARGQRTLTFTERVAYQQAIEELYWRHRIWPKENANPKPPFDAVMSQEQLEKKVADYLRKSQALEDYWQRPITAEQLQAEMDRMAKHTKQPEILRELFEALSNDPFMVAECLARPVLAERFVTNFSGLDEETLESWLATAENQTANVISIPSSTYRLPIIVSGCVEDNWTPTTGPPDGRMSPTAVWTGSEMIVWGGAFGIVDTNTGGRYDPATDTWTVTSTTNAPSAREGHTAVWNGTEMIVWGGTDNSTIFNTGSRYSPVTNTWTATSTSNAPAARRRHTAVWTGSNMIVWGGDADLTGNTAFDTGGKYNPNTDSWTATSTTNAPTARYLSTAVWAGSEMIVWGGFSPTFSALNNGGRYNPGTDSWMPTSTVNAPIARFNHTAVWTGTETIVWGGTTDFIQLLSTGGRYNPSTDSWTPTSTANEPSARIYHTAVWTGSTMIVWGGSDGNFDRLNTGGRYNPVANSWTNTSTTNAPVGRVLHNALWTGSEMIVWGGGGGNGFGDFFNTGGRYNPNTDSWTATSTSNVPTARDWHTAVWTGSEIIVWGGDAGGRLSTGARESAQPLATTHKFDHGILGSTPSPTPTPTATPIPSHGTGAMYDPSTDNWTATSTSSAPSARGEHTAVWTGSEMIVWGGFDGIVHLKTGGRFNPATDSWTATSTTNVPETRSGHTAVWSGGEMIVWGGFNGFNLLNTGGGYNATTDTWRAIAITDAPTARYQHTAIWTGSEMIVWGGRDGNSFLDTGGKYNPGTDAWAATTTNNAPSGRNNHTAIWTASEMIVWGGSPGVFLYENTGGKYNPIINSWLPTSTIGAPSARASHTAVWTGREMIVWGGGDESHSFLFFDTGGRYDPSTDSWIDTNTTDAPTGRQFHTAVWTGDEMIVWGGEVGGGAFASSGGRYCVQPGSTPTATPRVTPRARPTPHPRP